MAEITKDVSSFIPDHLQPIKIDAGGLRSRDALLVKLAGLARRLISLRRIKRKLIKNARHVRKKFGDKEHVVSDVKLSHNRVNAEVASIEARHHHLANCFLKGTAYKRAEAICYTNPDFERVLEYARDYTHHPYYIVQQLFAEWRDAAISGQRFGYKDGKKIERYKGKNQGMDISATFKAFKQYFIRSQDGTAIKTTRAEAAKQRKAFPPKKKTLAEWNAEKAKNAEIDAKAAKIKGEQTRGSGIVSMTDRVMVNKLNVIISEDKERGLWFVYATQIPSICAMGTDRDQTMLKFELMVKAVESTIEKKRAALP